MRKRLALPRPPAKVRAERQKAERPVHDPDCCPTCGRRLRKQYTGPGSHKK